MYASAITKVIDSLKYIFKKINVDITKVYIILSTMKL